MRSSGPGSKTVGEQGDVRGKPHRPGQHTPKAEGRRAAPQRASRDAYACSSLSSFDRSSPNTVRNAASRSPSVPMSSGRFAVSVLRNATYSSGCRCRRKVHQQPPLRHRRLPRSQVSQTGRCSARAFRASRVGAGCGHSPGTAEFACDSHFPSSSSRTNSAGRATRNTSPPLRSATSGCPPAGRADRG